MRNTCLAIAVLIAATVPAASAQQEVLREKKSNPESAQGKLQEYGQKHKAFKKDRVSLFEADASVDMTSPYGRIAAGCLNQQDSLDTAGVQRANHCIEVRTKALDAGNRKKKPSAEKPAMDDAAAPLGQAHDGEAVPEQP